MTSDQSLLDSNEMSLDDCLLVPKPLIAVHLRKRVTEQQSRMSWTDREGEDKAKKVLSDVEISPAIPRLFTWSSMSNSCMA